MSFKVTTLAAGLHCGQYQTRKVQPRKGKGSYSRKAKHRNPGE